MERVLNLYAPDGTHLGFMVRRPGRKTVIGPFQTIGAAIRQAEEDQTSERRGAHHVKQGW